MYIKIHAVADAKREVVKKIAADTYEIHVREPKERNAANARIREVLADTLGVPLGKIKIVTGHRSKRKIFMIGR